MKNLILDTLRELFGGCDTITSIKRVLGVLILVVTFVLMTGVESLGFINSLLVIGTSVFLWFACGINNAMKD